MHTYTPSPEHILATAMSMLHSDWAVRDKLPTIVVEVNAGGRTLKSAPTKAVTSERHNTFRQNGTTPDRYWLDRVEEQLFKQLRQHFGSIGFEVGLYWHDEPRDPWPGVGYGQTVEQKISTLQNTVESMRVQIAQMQAQQFAAQMRPVWDAPIMQHMWGQAQRFATVPTPGGWGQPMPSMVQPQYANSEAGAGVPPSGCEWGAPNQHSDRNPWDTAHDFANYSGQTTEPAPSPAVETPALPEIEVPLPPTAENTDSQ